MAHKYAHHAKMKIMDERGGREVTVTMSSAAYKDYMTDKYDDKGHVVERGFKNDDQLLDWINKTWGLLGTVTGIALEN